MSEVRFNKNGYEIRADVLAMAKEHVYSEFNYKWQGWELTSARDEKTGQIVDTKNMPQYPNLESVLETAEKLYSFVNNGNKK